MCPRSNVSPSHLFVLKRLLHTQRATKVKIYVGISLKPLRWRDPALTASACGKCACAFTCVPRGEHALPRALQEEGEFLELLLIMPPSKVCPQCDAVVHIRLKVCKSCQHVFRTKRQTEQNIPGSAKLTKDKLRKACKRAAESSEQALQRKQQNREHMANFRANESSEQTFHRKQQHREHMAKIRAIESSEQTLRRQQQDKEHKASLRSVKTSNSVQQAIETFLTVIRNGPDFVCTCCHRKQCCTM